MNRREFFIGAGTFAAAFSAKPTFAQRQLDTQNTQQATPFTLNYATHLGHFEHSAGNNIFDQINYAADLGFRGWEENFMSFRPIDEQKKIGKLLEQRDMTMGVFISGMAKDFWQAKPCISRADESQVNAFLDLIKQQVKTAQYVNAKWSTVVPGFIDHKIPLGFQTTNMIDVLKRASEIFAQHDVIMVLEPLNTRIDHPEVFLQTVSQANAICEAVDSPYCKILFDIYHEQIQSGNLIPTIDAAWEHTAYFQIGDTPGRNEPTTGEINYKTVFKHIYEKGYTGVLGMEHGKSKEGIAGEEALVRAYRECDPVS